MADDDGRQRVDPTTFVFLPRTLCGARPALLSRISVGTDGIVLAWSQRVSEITSQGGYGEPTVMWRMNRADGQSSHAVIAPRPDGAAVVWFVNGRHLGRRDFDDWAVALRWCDQLQAQNWAAGWRTAD